MRMQSEHDSVDSIAKGFIHINEIVAGSVRQVHTIQSDMVGLQANNIAFAKEVLVISVNMSLTRPLL